MYGKIVQILKLQVSQWKGGQDNRREKKVTFKSTLCVFVVNFWFESQTFQIQWRGVVGWGIGGEQKQRARKTHNRIMKNPTIKVHGVSCSVACTFLLTSPSESPFILLKSPIFFTLLDKYKDPVTLEPYFHLLKNFFTSYKYCLCSSSDAFSLIFAVQRAFA